MNEIMQWFYYFIVPVLMLILIRSAIRRQSIVMLTMNKKELVIKALGLPDRLTIKARKEYSISRHCAGYCIAEVAVKYYDGTCEEHYTATKTALICLCPDCQYVLIHRH